MYRVNKSGSRAGEENEGAGLREASAMSRRGDRRVAFRRTDGTQGPWAREGQAGQGGERACAQPGSVPGERKASEKQRGDSSAHAGGRLDRSTVEAVTSEDSPLHSEERKGKGEVKGV